MTDVADAFKHGKAFIPFVTAGDPDLETTKKLVEAMVAAGADLIELGIPFSDPIAEGPVIQAADVRALSNHVTLDEIFAMVKTIELPRPVPLVMMTYVNPVFVYGAEKFTKKAKECGICGLIVPDEPYEEKAELQPACRKAGLKLVSMIAPTSGGRIRMIAGEAEGFVYCVSSLGVTGVRTSFSNNLPDVVTAIKQATKIPVAVGFGVSTPEQARAIAKFADGVIVGSAIVKLVAAHGRDSVPYVSDYVKSMKDAVRSED
ncbi:MAG: tryptophan synthase subunit alpha [Candidatus Methanomethylophilus sp.]|nr:tryptophan synthase subunit alpha [Methanomethylophilus sp.]MDD4222372.1 tryptophan synthase subunit alpha [Methanomethylophilus sp.]MDD4669291.1 tryptophan synthase subunit alpha [Methanomethylophilus sp.]